MPKKKKPIRLTADQFLETVRGIHGDKFDYSKVAFTNMQGYLTVTCPTHGDFSPRAVDFFRGSGCRKCHDLTRNTNKITPFEVFVERAREAHGDLYQYHRESYKTFSAKTKITCISHGDFWQTGRSHTTHGGRCPKCLNRNVDVREYLNIASTKHQGRFTYPSIEKEYETLGSLITITCPTHGDYLQTAGQHLKTEFSCRSCATQGNLTTTSEFVEKARSVHGDTYDYSKVLIGSTSRDRVEIVCKKHGSFWQSAVMHTSAGSGCSACSTIFSKPHQKVVKLLEDLGYGGELSVNNRSLIKPYEVDIYIPSKKLAIEVNGIYWHSTNSVEQLGYAKRRHKHKLDLCRAAGVGLLQVTDLEIADNFDKICDIVSLRLGQGATRIYARSCTIREISSSEAKLFLNTYHLQGYCPSSINLGLIDSLGNPVMVMTFGKPRFAKDHTYELLRLCSKQGINVIGGASRLFKEFSRNFLLTGERIISYCDLRFFSGEVYKALGFRLLRETSPNYSYTNGACTRTGSRYKYQKHKLAKLLPVFDPNLTEVQNMFANGYRILYDCGNSVWEYVKPALNK